MSLLLQRFIGLNITLPSAIFENKAELSEQETLFSENGYAQNFLAMCSYTPWLDK